MNTVRKAHGHKSNWICPVEKCGYSSKRFIQLIPEFKISHKESTHSTKCPRHQVLLINAGGSIKMPKQK